MFTAASKNNISLMSKDHRETTRHIELYGKIRFKSKWQNCKKKDKIF